MDRKTVATTEPNFVGRFDLTCGFDYSFDGRYLISYTKRDLSLIDLFHNKKIELRFDIPSANSVGLPLSANEYYYIRTLYALDSNTVLILFEIHCVQYLAIGELDFGRSLVVFKHPAVSIDYYFSYKRWFPLSNPPNLHDGVILKLSDSIREAHFVIKMGPDNQLGVSQLHVPLKMELFACFDGFLYGLVESHIENNNYGNRPIELVKFSISSGEHFHVQTTNWKIIRPTVGL
ncbi:hypothetical protein M3Y95_00219100 [Aphelenchoides besseyi]|nr:hypothetical protein M3Y95_00219100 [Aphelenchoides besseyi]